LRQSSSSMRSLFFRGSPDIFRPSYPSGSALNSPALHIDPEMVPEIFFSDDHVISALVHELGCGPPDTGVTASD
jgi:hypothetical protein